MSDAPKALVLAYHEAFYRNDRADIRAVVAEGNDVCVVYESRMKVPSMPIITLASWVKVENGKIVHFTFTSTPHLLSKQGRVA